MEIKDRELTAKQLEEVTAAGEDDGRVATEMVCDECPENKLWRGNFMNGVYDCPQCGAHAFHGVSTRPWYY